jgi:hypothetical protein
MNAEFSQVRPIMPFRLMLDEAMRLTRKHFMVIYPAVAIPMAVAGVAMVVAQTPVMEQMFGADPSTFGPDFIVSWLSLMGLGMLYMLLYWIASCVILMGATEAAAQRPVSMAAAWSLLLKPPVLVTLVSVALLMGLGFGLCILPGYLLGVLFGLIVPVMLLEQVYGSQAMKRSSDLLMYNPQGLFVTHPFVRLAVIWFLGWLIAYIVGMAVGLPFGIAQQVIMWRSLAGAESAADPASFMPILWLQVPQVVLGTLARHAVTLYVSFCIALFYLDVRFRKEGTDLEAALDAVGAPVSGASEPGPVLGRGGSPLP